VTGRGLLAVVAAVVAASGTYLLYTAFVFGRRGFGPRRRSFTRVGPGGRSWRTRLVARQRDWWAQAGLAEVRPVELIGLAAVLAAAGGLGGLIIFGTAVPAVMLAVWAGVGWPLASCKLRRDRLRTAAQEHWPRLLEEIRVLTANLGRSVPQALFEAGRRAPVVLRPAFAAAQREWLLSVDFERTVAVLKARLADPTVDVACETLLVAHQLGGSDLDRRLEALIADRVLDLQDRKDARAAQSGVRFSRLFVLLVPCGMALVGSSIGTGRAAYATPWGQSMVALGVGVIAACWIWASRLLRLPPEERVFR
jgi:tight adherence protein B